MSLFSLNATLEGETDCPFLLNLAAMCGLLTFKITVHSVTQEAAFGVRFNEPEHWLQQHIDFK